MTSTIQVPPGTVATEDIEPFDKLLHIEGAGRFGVPTPPKLPRLTGPNGENGIEIPFEVYKILRAVVDQLREGNGISVIPLHAELSTMEAADLLNVSRPFLIKQLEAKELPYRKVGTHRRIRFSDVMEYRAKLSGNSRDALATMAEDAEEAGLYGD